MKRLASLPVFIVVLLVLLRLLGVSPSSAQSSSLVFAVVGDYGMDNAPEASVANMIASWNPEIIITTGDDYYNSAGGSGSAKYDESTGAYYCDYLKDITTSGTRCPVGLAATNKFFPSLGNHDYTDAGTTNSLPTTYTSYFTLPGAGYTSSTTNERYYDFVAGPVHFFVVNSNNGAGQEPDGTSSSSVQAAWLQNQLAASTSTWNVVYFHHPSYSSGSGHGSSTWMQWPFAAWGADVVFQGHDHTYERILRDGMVYFVNGTGGASLYGFNTPVTGSVFRYNANYGAQKVTASDSAITFDFYSIDGGGTLQDSYTLTTGGPTPTASHTATPDLSLVMSFQQGVLPAGSYAGASDSTISQANPAINYGAAADLLVDGDDPAGSGNDLSTLLRWDVSQIPVDSQVVSASLSLNILNVSGNSYPIYELKQNWNESQVNWSQYASGSAWQTAGAQGVDDRGGALLGSLTAPALGQVTLDLNALGVALIQSWVNNPLNNHGLIFASPSNTDGVDFSSSQSTTAANRPRLTIRYLPGSATPTHTPTPTTTFTPTATFTSTPTPTATYTSTPTATFTPSPVPQTLHSGDLDRSASASGSKWTARVVITVHNASHAVVSGVTVTGNWGGGANGSASCTTGTNGQCTVTKSNLKSSLSSVTFTLSNMTRTGWTYASNLNHDPDGDSNGSTITIPRP
jgi:hypothetical protein